MRDILHKQKTTVWYLVFDLPYDAYKERFDTIKDVRLYEVSRCGDNTTGILIGGKTLQDAERNAFDIIEIVQSEATLTAAMDRSRMEIDAEEGRKVAVVANKYGWNGVENSKILSRFIESELRELKQLRKKGRKR